MRNSNSKTLTNAFLSHSQSNLDYIEVRKMVNHCLDEIRMINEAISKDYGAKVYLRVVNDGWANDLIDFGLSIGKKKIYMTENTLSEPFEARALLRELATYRNDIYKFITHFAHNSIFDSEQDRNEILNHCLDFKKKQEYDNLNIILNDTKLINKKLNKI